VHTDTRDGEEAVARGARFRGCHICHPYTLVFFPSTGFVVTVATMGILVEGVSTEYRQREEHGKVRERESERVSLAQDTGRTGRERG